MRLFDLRQVVFGALLPVFIFEIGIGAMLPVLPFRASELGASLAMAGVVTALYPVGMMVSDIPSGVLVNRLGNVRAMMLSCLVGLIGFGICALSGNLVGLSAGVFTVGVAASILHIARQTHLTEVTAPAGRGRVLSTLGGTHRMGTFIGPFVGALILAIGSVGQVFILGVFTSLIAFVVVLATFAGVRQGVRSAFSAAKHRPTSALSNMLSSQWKLLATLGVGALLVGVMRGARRVVIPLWGESLGLEPEVVSLVFGASGGLDMLLFYPAGKIMDSLGRLWIAVPSMILMASALILMTFIDNFSGFLLSSLILGLGNGLGSGVIMTIGSDVAPQGNRAGFLGAWRLLQDSGSSAGPLILAGGAAMGSLALGMWVAALLGITAGVMLAKVLPKWSKYANNLRKS